MPENSRLPEHSRSLMHAHPPQNSRLLEPSHMQPYSMYQGFGPPRMHTPSLYSSQPVTPLPPRPDSRSQVPSVAMPRSVPTHPTLPTAALSDDELELEQPLLATKRSSAPITQPSRAPPKKKIKGSGKSGKGDGGAVRKGRKAGASGYSVEEVKHMLKEIQRRLPLGGKAWEVVAVSYNQWAQRNHVMERSSKAIRAKYDMVYTFTLYQSV
jgi:hypothetical protein